MPTYRMTLTMLSPVHVGSGEEIEPTEYVVQEVGAGQDANFMFSAVDSSRLLGRLTDAQRREFNDAADRGGTVYLRKFIQKIFDPTDSRWRTVCHPDVYDLYQKGLDSDSARLRINLMTRDLRTGFAYLPGSSIKGALRTAWVNRKVLAYAGTENLARIDDRDFESEILGYRIHGHGRPRADIKADPLRAVKVGDAPLCDRSNTIDPARIYKPKPAAGQPDPAGIQMYYDMTFSRLDDEEITAAGRFAMDERLARVSASGARRWNFDRCVTDSITAADLLVACNDFYRPRLIDEVERFPKLSGPGRRLIGWAEQMKRDEALIRLGRFSHVECVTVERPGKSARIGTTRTLANNEYPLGWAKIRLDPA